MTAKENMVCCRRTHCFNFYIRLEKEWLELKYVYFIFCFLNETVIIFFARAVKSKFLFKPD